MAIQLVDVRPDLEPRARRERGWVDARTGDDDHAQSRHAFLRVRERVDDATEQVAADS